MVQWGGEQGRWCVDSEVKGVRKLRDPELGNQVMWPCLGIMGVDQVAFQWDTLFCVKSFKFLGK